VPKPTVRTKTGRITKPSAKKRAKDEAHGDHDADARPANGTIKAEPKAKRIKVLKTPVLNRAPTLKLKNTGKLPFHPPGDGYDSEAEDREIDPVIEEQFVLRMPPGEDCDYIRRAIQERKIGIPRHQGGADLSMKWVDDEGRRCMVTVQGQPYAAVLLDLPTITEGMKTWDRKSMVKTADICQMLLVFQKVKNEEEVKQAKLPKLAEQGYRWPHGLTPPMHDCIHRRFRKRLSKLEIQNKEAEVERLLKADQEAVSTKWEFVDDRQQTAAAAREDSQAYEEEEEEEEEAEEEEDAEADAEGEMEDYFGDGDIAEADFVVDDALLEAEFEAQVSDAMGEDPMEVETPTVGGLEVATPMTAHTTTPAGHTDGSVVEDEEDEEEESEDEEDNGDVEDDDEDGARHDDVSGVRTEIALLKKQLTELESQLARSVQPIMKRRLEQNIKNLKAEVELKRSAIGDVDDD
jgi:transcription initiation factor TFIID subunit 7